MGKLSDAEQKALDELTAKANASDDDDDDEIEWWEEDDKGKRRGGRMTTRRAKSTGLFSDLFGDKQPPKGNGKDGKAGDKDDNSGGGSGSSGSRTSERYFGSGSRDKDK